MPRMNDIIRDSSGDSPVRKPEELAAASFRNLAALKPEEQPAAAADWYKLAEEELGRVRASVKLDQAFPIDNLLKIATGIVGSLETSDHLLAKSISGYTGTPIVMNMVNVAVMATKIGMAFNYRREELVRLALAGLLHDVGMIALPETLLAKAEKLTPQDRELMKQHPQYGYQILMKLGSSYEWLANVALQEHERWNGQGYPKGLKENQIHDYARIIGIVDIFDALMNARPYRRKLLPHEAVRELLVTERTAFPSQVIKAFVQQFSVFPLGTSVLLNTGEVGVVIKLNPRFPLRPVIRVSMASDRTAAAEAKDVDLSTTSLVNIVEVVAPEESADVR
jgi:HD-GYP domain-containing protein (c-di-GMP phosphodiesterase class II)